MDRGGGRVLREVFLGSTTERVIRLGQRPVLAVRRRPRAAYRRPAIALALDEAAPAIVSLALRVLPSLSEITVLHGYEVPLEGWLASDDETEALRNEQRKRAVRTMWRMLETALRPFVPSVVCDKDILLVFLYQLAQRRRQGSRGV